MCAKSVLHAVFFLFAQVWFVFASKCSVSDPLGSFFKYFYNTMNEHAMSMKATKESKTQQVLTDFRAASDPGCAQVATDIRSVMQYSVRI